MSVELYREGERGSFSQALLDERIRALLLQRCALKLTREFLQAFQGHLRKANPAGLDSDCVMINAEEIIGMIRNLGPQHLFEVLESDPKIKQLLEPTPVDRLMWHLRGFVTAFGLPWISRAIFTVGWVSCLIASALCSLSLPQTLFAMLLYTTGGAIILTALALDRLLKNTNVKADVARVSEKLDKILEGKR